MLVGLEIGPGAHPLKAGARWQTMGVGPGHTYPGRWGTDRIPGGDNRFDLVYASHVIEHVDWRRVAGALREVYRVIKPGGVFEVWTVNFEYVVRCYLARKCGDKWRRDNAAGNPIMWASGRIFAYGSDPSDPNWHHSLFDEAYLRGCLEAAGFADVARLDKPRGYDHGPVNLGVGARKPA